MEEVRPFGDGVVLEPPPFPEMREAGIGEYDPGARAAKLREDMVAAQQREDWDAVASLAKELARAGTAANNAVDGTGPNGLAHDSQEPLLQPKNSGKGWVGEKVTPLKHPLGSSEIAPYSSGAALRLAVPSSILTPEEAEQRRKERHEAEVRSEEIRVATEAANAERLKKIEQITAHWANACHCSIV